MRHLVPRALRIAVIFLGVGLLPSWNATAATPGTAAPYSPAKACSGCHQAIYKSWSEGPHARSASSPAYLEALARAAAAAPDAPEARRRCVWCHAPTTLITGDVDLKESISREGITCDFCHTVAEVDLEKGGNPFVLEPGEVKRGPVEYAASPGHKTAYSPLHRASPLLCASCHEFKNAAGVAVLSTYSEWKEGPYPARGVPCQECHMALVPGATVKDSLKQPTLRVVNLHRVVGGSALSQLNRGLELKIESLSRSGGSAEVTIVVTNVAAGHSVPGGLATKSLVLAVAVETGSGKLEHRQERVYRRELKDAQGHVLESVADMFLSATSVGNDNRLKPREGRTERFSVAMPPDARAVIARLEYRDGSDPRSEPTTVLVTEARRDLSTR